MICRSRRRPRTSRLRRPNTLRAPRRTLNARIVWDANATRRCANSTSATVLASESRRSIASICAYGAKRWRSETRGRRRNRGPREPSRLQRVRRGASQAVRIRRRDRSILLDTTTTCCERSADMGSIFVRGNKLYAKLKTTEGAWIQAATGFSVGDEQQAQRWLADRERKVEAQRAAAAAGDAPGPMTVRKWAGEWLITRREAGHDWKADKGRLEHHILPIIGHLMLVDVRTHHIAELVHKIRFASDLDNKLAPRTLRNIYSVA